MLNFTWGTGAVSKYVYENVLSQNFEGDWAIQVTITKSWSLLHLLITDPGSQITFCEVFHNFIFVYSRCNGRNMLSFLLNFFYSAIFWISVLANGVHILILASFCFPPNFVFLFLKCIFEEMSSFILYCGSASSYGHRKPTVFSRTLYCFMGT